MAQKIPDTDVKKRPSPGKEKRLADEILRGRDAKTGRFIPLDVARRRKATAIIERRDGKD
jgi:hypothetical protein